MADRAPSAALSTCVTDACNGTSEYRLLSVRVRSASPRSYNSRACALSSDSRSRGAIAPVVTALTSKTTSRRTESRTPLQSGRLAWVSPRQQRADIRLKEDAEPSFGIVYPRHDAT